MNNKTSRPYGSTHYPELSPNTRRWVTVWNVLTYAILLVSSAVAFVQTDA